MKSFLMFSFFIVNGFFFKGQGILKVVLNKIEHYVYDKKFHILGTKKPRTPTLLTNAQNSGDLI